MKKIYLLAIMLLACFILATGCSQKKTSEFSGDERGYSEDDIELPFDQGKEKAISFVNRKKSLMYLYSREKESGNYHIYELMRDHTWKEINANGMNEFFKNVTYEPRMIEGGLDGTINMLYFDDDYLPHIARQQGNAIEKVPVMDLMKTESIPLQEYPNGVKSLEDGSIIVSYASNKGAVLYDQDGNEMRRFDKWEQGVNVTRNIGVCPGRFISVNDSGTGFCIYDTDTGEKKNEIKVGEQAAHSYLKEGSGDDFFFLNEKGIHHIITEGSIVETIIEGDDMPALKLEQEAVSFETGDNNSFYVLFQKDGKSSLKYYSYQEKKRMENQMILKIAGLKKSNTIQQAIIEFEKKNPGVKIDFQDYGEIKERTTLADAIRIINTEVLSGGNGPDLLILDGLPVDAYTGKGALLDLSEITNELEGKSGILDHIDLQKDAEGKVFTIPSRFSVPLLIGHEDAIRHMKTLDELEKYLSSGNAEEIIASGYFEEIAGNIFNMYYNDLCATSFPKEDLAKYMNVVMQLSRMTGAVSQEEEEGGPEIEENMFGIGGASDTGKMRVAISEMKSVMDLSYPATFQGKYGAQVKTIQSLYIPYDMVGVHAETTHKEEAKAFIRTLLSGKIQSLEIGEGFPVNKQAFESLDPVVSDVEAMVEGDEGQIITFQQAGQEELQAFKALTETLKVPLMVDSAIEELTMEQMKRVYAGGVSSEEAAKDLASKIQLYWNE